MSTLGFAAGLIFCWGAIIFCVGAGAHLLAKNDMGGIACFVGAIFIAILMFIFVVVATAPPYPYYY